MSNAQNCELSAPQNLWSEIREFWACSFILFIHSVLCGSERKCAEFSTAKVAFSLAVEPLLHPHTSTFARQYCHYCLTIQPLLSYNTATIIPSKWRYRIAWRLRVLWKRRKMTSEISIIKIVFVTDCYRLCNICMWWVWIYVYINIAWQLCGLYWNFVANL